MRTNKVAVAELKNMHINTDPFALSDQKNCPKVCVITLSPQNCFLKVSFKKKIG